MVGLKVGAARTSPRNVHRHKLCSGSAAEYFEASFYSNAGNWNVQGWYRSIATIIPVYLPAKFFDLITTMHWSHYTGSGYSSN